MSEEQTWKPKPERTAAEGKEQSRNDAAVGGTAFPQLRQFGSSPGMSLLDYFAGQALVGMMADPDEHGRPEDAAEAAYRFAEAMLRERAKRR